MSSVAAFTVHYTRMLDPHGRATQPLPAFAAVRETMVAMYRAMQLTRAFDAKAVALQRTGRLGTFASSLGQEAVAVGMGSAMRRDDIFVPSFREAGTMLMRGVTLQELLLYWGGDERGNDYGGPRQDFPICVPVGSQAPHAAGAALAVKLRGGARAVLCTFGDGATSKGDVYEAMNVAGVWHLPVVFVVNNNQWAISVPRHAQSAAQTLAQKAFAAGFVGEQVDGNDVIAVRHVCAQALAKARDQSEPHLIEALTYRLSDHTTADDASRYRDDAVVSEHWHEEPLARLRQYLIDRFHWSRDEEEQVLADCRREVDQAADDYLATPEQPIAALFDYVYAELPADLQPQRAEALLQGDAHA
jgi:pyruvate dehydrogenase E1 component alpha subunit